IFYDAGKVAVLEDAVAGVNAADSARALVDMRQRGAFLLASDGHDRAGRCADDSISDAAEEEFLNSAAAMRTDDDQIGMADPRRPNDLGRLVALAQLDGDPYAAPLRALGQPFQLP